MLTTSEELVLFARLRDGPRQIGRAEALSVCGGNLPQPGYGRLVETKYGSIHVTNSGGEYQIECAGVQRPFPAEFVRRVKAAINN